jgi:hypothetical protein
MPLAAYATNKKIRHQRLTAVLSQLLLLLLLVVVNVNVVDARATHITSPIRCSTY